ncbi:MAG: LysE family transporter [Spirochaetia bacterium]
MAEVLPAFLSYVFVTTFTPGPNNVSSASMGITYGYVKTLRYILGIITGFSMIMFFSGLVTESLIRLLPRLESVLRILGALYMIYLAVIILKASSHEPHRDEKILATFSRGLLLQLVNFKVMVFGITVYSGFLVEHISTIWETLTAALFLSAFAFASTSLWALFGAALKHYFANRTFTFVFNGIMALLLLYSAAVIAGIL